MTKESLHKYRHKETYFKNFCISVVLYKWHNRVPFQNIMIWMFFEIDIMSKVLCKFIYLHVENFAYTCNTIKFCLWWPIFLFPFFTGFWSLHSHFTIDYCNTEGLYSADDHSLMKTRWSCVQCRQYLPRSHLIRNRVSLTYLFSYYLALHRDW